MLGNLDTGLSRSVGPRRNIMARVAGRFEVSPEILLYVGTVGIIQSEYTMAIIITY